MLDAAVDRAAVQRGIVVEARIVLREGEAIPVVIQLRTERRRSERLRDFQHDELLMNRTDENEELGFGAYDSIGL
jgi:hypothetical protein